MSVALGQVSCDVRVDRAAVADLEFDDATDLLDDIGVDLAQRTGAIAPRDTGGGAASFAHVVDADGDGAYVDVGPTEEHYYMSLVETGTEHIPAQPHMRPALEQTTI